MLLLFPILFQGTIAQKPGKQLETNLRALEDIEKCCQYANCSNIANGICDFDLFNHECSWDFGDCRNCPEVCTLNILENGVCDENCFTFGCFFDVQDCRIRQMIQLDILDDREDVELFKVNDDTIQVSKFIESNFAGLKFDEISYLKGFINYTSDQKFQACNFEISGYLLIQDLTVDDLAFKDLNISIKNSGTIELQDFMIVGNFSFASLLTDSTVVIHSFSNEKKGFLNVLNLKISSYSSISSLFRLSSSSSVSYVFNLKASTLNISNFNSGDSKEFFLNSKSSNISIHSSVLQEPFISLDSSSVLINSSSLNSRIQVFSSDSSSVAVLDSNFSSCSDILSKQNKSSSLELIGVSYASCPYQSLLRLNHLVVTSEWLFESSYSFIKNCSDGQMDSFGCTSCPNDYYRFKHMSHKMCFKCTDSMKCENGNIRPRDTFFRIEEEDFNQVFRPCPNSNACESVKGKNITECKEGYSGRFCANCEDGYDTSGRFVCSKCPELSNNILVILAAVFLVSFFIIYLIKSTVLAAFMPSEFYAIALRIGINYFQVIYLCLQFKIKWPGNNKNDQTDNKTNVAGESTLYFSIKCLLDEHLKESGYSYFYIRIVFMALLPAIIFLFSVAYLAVLKLYKHLRHREVKLSIYKPITYTVPFLLIYPYVITYSLLPLACNNLVQDKPEYFDEEVDLTSYRYLISYPDILCNWDDHYRKIVWVTGFSLVVWGFGVPVLIFYKLHKERKNLFKYKVKYTFGFLINGYKHERFYWEFIIFIKKLVIVFLTVFMQSGFSITLQSVLLITFLIVGFILQLHFKPYITEQLNNLEIFGSVAAIVTVLSAIIYSETYEQSKALIVILILIITLVNVFYILYWASFLSKEFYLYLLQNIEYLKKRFLKRDGFGDISKEWDKLNFVYFKEFQKLYTLIEFDINPPPNYLGESPSYFALMKHIVAANYHAYVDNRMPKIEPLIRRRTIKIPASQVSIH